MVLKAEVKQLLDRNRSAVPEAVRARNSQAMRLNLGGRNITLVNAPGRATEAGKYFYQKLRSEFQMLGGTTTRRPIGKTVGARILCVFVTVQRCGCAPGIRRGVSLNTARWGSSSTRGGQGLTSCRYPPRFGRSAGTARRTHFRLTFQPRTWEAKFGNY